MAKKKSKESGIESISPSNDNRDEVRMARSGAAESGYHAPSSQDIDDLRKDHSTASEPGLINADEGVRRDSEEIPGPIDSLSGKVVEAAHDEDVEKQASA